jgi:hypothetical protein
MDEVSCRSGSPSLTKGSASNYCRFRGAIIRRHGEIRIEFAARQEATETERDIARVSGASRILISSRRTKSVVVGVVDRWL